jgi:hypothetical protein
MGKKVKKIARKHSIACPNCRQEIQSYHSIWFVENYTVVIEGRCCGEEITSGERNILGLFPTSVKEKSH